MVLTIEATQQRRNPAMTLYFTRVCAAIPMRCSQDLLASLNARLGGFAGADAGMNVKMLSKTHYSSRHRQRRSEIFSGPATMVSPPPR